jgi:hypothetical protein
MGSFTGEGHAMNGRLLKSARTHRATVPVSRWAALPLAITLSIVPAVGMGRAAFAADQAASTAAWSDEDGDLARKADILHGPRWQRAMTELAGWLATQTIHSPTEVRRIKIRFNERVEAMSSHELEYLLDSISVKLDLLDTPEARDAKAWLGEYLSSMSDARRARELRTIPNILEMNAAQLWDEIQRIDRKRTSLQQRQQGFEMRRDLMVERAAAGRQATAAASQATASRLRSAPSHSPYRQGGGSPPFSDVQPRRLSIGVGPFGAYVGF